MILNYNWQKDAFRENKVVNTYELPEVDFAKAVDLDYIKK